MNFDLDYEGFEEFMKTRTNDVELKGVYLDLDLKTIMDHQ